VVGEHTKSSTKLTCVRVPGSTSSPKRAVVRRLDAALE
jgi:hypothetical protein